MSGRDHDITYGGEIALASVLMVIGATGLAPAIVSHSAVERVIGLVIALWLLTVGALLPMAGVFWHYAALVTFALMAAIWALAAAGGAQFVPLCVGVAYSAGAVVYLAATVNRKRRLSSP